MQLSDATRLPAQRGRLLRLCEEDEAEPRGRQAFPPAVPQRIRAAHHRLGDVLAQSRQGPRELA
eukprot:8694423-Alexandrium_andersonii.AAC.1